MTSGERQQANGGQIPIQDTVNPACDQSNTKSGSDPHLRFPGDYKTDEVRKILSQVPDPEIPVVSIEELGILRDIIATQTGFEIVITPTYSGCPAVDQIQDDIRTALAAHQIQVTVTTRLAPAWTTDWMSDATRDKLRAYGIAPPQHGAETQAKVIQFAPKRVAAPAINLWADGPFGSKTVPCPQCGSADTTETSHFGSTACKALYKCLACLEPFDYFKPY